MRLVLQTSPYVAPPTTAAEAQAHLRITDGSESTLLDAMIEAATRFGERVTGRAFRANVWLAYFDDFESEIDLPIPDVATVDSVEHLVASSWVVVSPSLYIVRRGRSRTTVELRNGASWPGNSDDEAERVRVTATQSPGGDVELMKAGILRLVASMWADRGDAEARSLGSNPDGWTRDTVLDPAKTSGAESIWSPLTVPGI